MMRIIANPFVNLKLNTTPTIADDICHRYEQKIFATFSDTCTISLFLFCIMLMVLVALIVQ